MKYSIPLALIVCFLCSNLHSYAQATLSIQGVIKNSDGTAVEDGDYEMTFKLYDDVPTEVWEETQPAVEVKGGVYSVLLGSVEGLPPFTTTNYELGVSIDGGQELQPRSKVTAAPFALALIGDENIFSGIGNVGIGTTSPDSSLDVNGSVRLGSQGLQIAENGQANFGNNVGFGTTDPLEKIHVESGNILVDAGNVNISEGDLLVGPGNVTSGVTRNITLGGARNASGLPYAELNFENQDDNAGDTTYVGAKIISHNASSSDGGDLRFFTKQNGSADLAESMRVSSDGIKLGNDGSSFSNIILGTVSFATSIPGNTSFTTNLPLTVTGAKVNSFVMVTPIDPLGGGVVIVQAYVDVEDNIKIKFRNTGGSSQSITGSYRVLVINL